MKLRLEENLGAAAGAVFRQEGFDAATVAEQAMCGTADFQLARHCARERRCLVTLDVAFANPFLYPPWEYAGIAVLRLPLRRAEPKGGSEEPRPVGVHSGERPTWLVVPSTAP